MRVASDFREMGVSGAYYISSINSWCGYYGERWFKHIRYYQLSNECGEPWKWRQFL